MKYLPWLVLVSCSITMLIVGINIDTIATSCLAFELAVCLFFAWKIRAAYKAAEKEQADESARAAADTAAIDPDVSRTGGSPGEQRSSDESARGVVAGPDVGRHPGGVRSDDL